MPYPVLSLLSLKEIRQNRLIWGIPYLFLLTIGFLNHTNTHWLSKDWVEILGTAFPVALAGAYGLQAFDSEEYTQTRDFLLTKPLTVNIIVWSKYFPSLAVLLLTTFLWQLILLPQSIQLPDIFNLQSLWFSAFILIITTVYNVAFTTGLIIKGPKKLLVALLLSFLSTGWILAGWCEAVTACYFASWSFNHYTLTVLVTLALTAGLIVSISLASINLNCWLLSKYPFEFFKKPLYWFSGFLLLFPLGCLLINEFQKPLVRPFNSLAASFFKLEEPWFVAVRGFRRPHKTGYAFVDSTGRIGLVKGNRPDKPKVIINPPTPVKTKGITWSPDGSCFSFDQNGLIYIYELANGQTTPLLPGDRAYWSEDNRQILVSQILNATTLAQNGVALPVQTIKFSIFDRLQNSVTYWARFSSGPAVAWEWDSARDQLLAIDPSWSLRLVHLKGKSTETINLLAVQPKYEIITRGQIIHSLNHYDLIICSRDLAKDRKSRGRFNLRWFTYHPQNQRLKLEATFRGIPTDQKDLILDPDGQRLLTSNGSGSYFAGKFNRR